MVAFSRLAVLGTVLPLVLAAVPSEPRPATELRLVKTSEEDPGTWMTEEEKFENEEEEEGGGGGGGGGGEE
ncbi:hypothetical protein O1611_g4086 [Lasiodiplodia mahajangana]|uniref:Uncharacterized protein n=1 Tax=Lasiodiplodia mahajangana TaxID=1108764 RepID=A0ACC2JQF8_9PEZI|nr:hypothetical protein O1611_g4086 [Lasiodiplodia mahajangana]